MSATRGIRIDKNYLCGIGSLYINSGTSQEHVIMCDRTFCSFFRLSPIGCTDLYYKLTVYGHQNPVNGSYPPLNVHESHLLLFLHYLNTYANEDICASFCKVAVKTWRKHVWNCLRVMCNGTHQMVSSLCIY